MTWASLNRKGVDRQFTKSGNIGESGLDQKNTRAFLGFLEVGTNPWFCEGISTGINECFNLFPTLVSQLRFKPLEKVRLALLGHMTQRRGLRTVNEHFTKFTYNGTEIIVR